MKAAIIGASFEALHTIQKAKELGVETIALDGNPNAEGLQAADKGIFVDISNEEATIEVLKQENPDFILTVPIGRYLTTIGAANDALSLCGITKQSAQYCTDKYLFHIKMSEAGLRSGNCFLVTADSLLQEYDSLQYPAVLKPRYGSGSRGIYFLENWEELETTLSEVQSEQEDYVLEEAARGKEYGVDGAVTNGEFHLILLREKINTPLPERQAVGYFSVMPETNVEQYLQKTVKALKLNNCLFHADLMIEEGHIFAIELSARPSGHYLHNIFTPMATGIDEAEEYIKFMSGQPYSFTPQETKSQLIHFFDLPQGTVASVKPVETTKLPVGVTLIKSYCTIKPGDILEKVTSGHSLMGRGYFILQSDSKESLLEGVKAVKNQFQMQ